MPDLILENGHTYITSVSHREGSRGRDALLPVHQQGLGAPLFMLHKHPVLWASIAVVKVTCDLPNGGRFIDDRELRRLIQLWTGSLAHTTTESPYAHFVLEHAGSGGTYSRHFLPEGGDTYITSIVELHVQYEALMVDELEYTKRAS